MDSKKLPEPMDEELVPVHADVLVPEPPPMPPTAARSAAASVPADVSNGDIFRLVQHLFKSTEQMRPQICETDEFSSKPEELAVNRTNTSTQLARVEGRLGTFDSRIIELDEAKPASYSSSVWGDMGCSPASQPAHFPHVWGSEQKRPSSFA